MAIVVVEVIWWKWKGSWMELVGYDACAVQIFGLVRCGVIPCYSVWVRIYISRRYLIKLCCEELALDV